MNCGERISPRARSRGRCARARLPRMRLCRCAGSACGREPGTVAILRAGCRRPASRQQASGLQRLDQVRALPSEGSATGNFPRICQPGAAQLPLDALQQRMSECGGISSRRDPIAAPPRIGRKPGEEPLRDRLHSTGVAFSAWASRRATSLFTSTPTRCRAR